jgi:hypothetical protein
MENLYFRQNSKSNRFFAEDWFSRSKWGRLRLPRQKDNIPRLKEEKDRFFTAPVIKTVVWAGN